MALDISRMRVLVVDPDQGGRLATRNLLSEIGVQFVRLAIDADEARAWLGREPIHVIIVDHELSGSGAVFVRDLRWRAPRPIQQVPTILVAPADPEVVYAARDAGANEFIGKPLTAKALKQRIDQILHHPRPFIRSETYVGPCRRRKKIKDWVGDERRGVAVSAPAPVVLHSANN
jgi:response regulator RpfG family c-di-GMP phosphodiesterase